MTTPPNILTIAGSDSGGGAGIQADIKTFSALNAYGASVITAVTAQNTQGVNDIHYCPAKFVKQQLKIVLDDIEFKAIKIGMLGNAHIIEAVAQQLEAYLSMAKHSLFIVLDPVMIAKSGQALLTDEDIGVLIEKLFPLVDLITPNLPEAARLLNLETIESAKNEEEMKQQGRALLELGAKAVLIKGGHLNSEYKTSPDYLIDADKKEYCFNSPRLQTTASHGTGCTLSAAIAALQPKSANLENTITKAKNYLFNALMHANKLNVGQKGTGHGPVHHFHHWWEK